ncbi:MAG: type I-E CRISPR-associated protein Cse2/CasB [Phyllobacteriaceae bacterium]|nr:type I-E CRISPR-associated protein Cse2/CasB [Phyllobacteriaceae bacterium]
MTDTKRPEETRAPPSRSEIVARWWREMQDTNPNGTPNPRVDRAARARLRRLEGPLAAADPRVVDLYRRLEGDRFDAGKLRVVVRVALVLAHVREEARGEPFPRSLGPSTIDADDGVLKALRFRSLLAARDEGDVVRRFRRAVALLGGRVNVHDLAAVLLGWDSDRVRTRFAFDYFAASAAVPPEATSVVA